MPVPDGFSDQSQRFDNRQHLKHPLSAYDTTKSAHMDEPYILRKYSFLLSVTLSATPQYPSPDPLNIWHQIRQPVYKYFIPISHQKEPPS